MYTAWPNTTTFTHTNRAFHFVTLWQDTTCSLWLNFSFIWVLLQECWLITLCSIAPGEHKSQAYGWLNFFWYQLISSGQILKFFYIHTTMCTLMSEFWILSMELVSCHSSGSWSLVVAHRNLENLWTPEHINEFHKKCPLWTTLSVLSETFCIYFSYFIKDCPFVLHLEYPGYASVILSKIALSVLQSSLTSFHYYIQKFQSPIFHYAISAMFLQLSMQALCWNVPLNQDLYIHPDQPTAPT